MQESNNDYMNNKYPTNPKLVIPDVRVSTPYIICAAIWFKDGNKYSHQPRNVDSGLVVCGRRHHNCFLTAFELNDILHTEKLRKELSVDEYFGIIWSGSKKFVHKINSSVFKIKTNHLTKA